ncbi:MAG: glycosyltransferase family 4 protein [Verrucomicrobiales bacterium]|nr:glycosyltransferase family 4 protein [Verrucomicrobiales bacterium]
MRILFLHDNFPAQFPHVATALAKDPNNQVIFGTTRKEGELPGVRRVRFQAKRQVKAETHHYLHGLERAVITGEAVYQLGKQLKKEGFVPDVIYGHSGWGPPLFIKDVFPKSRLLCYFEWFYHSYGSDVDFDPAYPPTADDQARIRMKNAPILLDLDACDRGMTPTHWQHQQFPDEWKSKIDVITDGFDTQLCKPIPGAKLKLDRISLDLSQAEQLITYTAWGMEPYRGFPQFMRAIAKLQRSHPNLHAIVVGDDRVVYGRQRNDGKSWKDEMLSTLQLDETRIHFPGKLPHDELRQVYQASSAHVYLTRPFILSWSMMEAMASGCLVIAADVPTTTEIITDYQTGLLVDFFDSDAIAAKIEEAIQDSKQIKTIRQNARQHIIDHYSLKNTLANHLSWIKGE